MARVRQQSNFSVLEVANERRELLGLLWERDFADGASTPLLKLQQLTELIVKGSLRSLEANGREEKDIDG